MKKNITGLIKSRLKEKPVKTIIRYKNDATGNYKTISSDEFIRISEKISMSLLSLGYGYEDKIGIFSDNIPRWTIADTGIIAIRAITVPFFATATVQQMQYIVDETQISLIFVGNAEQYEKACMLFGLCKSLKTIVVFDDQFAIDDARCMTWEKFCSLGDNPGFEEQLKAIENQAQENDIATIIYTSGTTGEPKGVMLDHHNFYHCFLIHDKRLNIRGNDVSLCFLPLSHIFERAWTLFLLYRGLTNVFLRNPRQVIEAMQEIKPNIMCTVPRFFEKTYEGIQAELMKWPAFKQAIFNWAIVQGKKRMEYVSQGKPVPFLIKIKYQVSNLLVLKKLRKVLGGQIRFMPCAGAAMSPSLIRFFHAAGIFVDYGYGTTETTATVSCFKTDIFSYESCGSIMPEIEVKIGGNNEIWVKGETVFRGYYNKPEETLKALSDGWYKTGDAGYLFGDDYLMMTDRIRDIFKTSGGKYVSPQKIELLLAQEPIIEQVMAIGDNRKFVTALIVPSKPNLLKLAEELGIKNSGFESLLTNEKIIEHFRQKIAIALLELSPFERIIRFTLLAEPFTIENKALTSTLKIRRKIVEEQYKDLIDKMYVS